MSLDTEPVFPMVVARGIGVRCCRIAGESVDTRGDLPMKGVADRVGTPAEQSRFEPSPSAGVTGSIG